VIDTSHWTTARGWGVRLYFQPDRKAGNRLRGFCGCWFAAALVYAWQFTGQARHRESADRAMQFYAPFVRDLTCWGTPMDTCKSIDSEGNPRLHSDSADFCTNLPKIDSYISMLQDAGFHTNTCGDHGFRTRPQCPPLKGSNLEYVRRIDYFGFQPAHPPDERGW
jgi:hypothetical protein